MRIEFGSPLLTYYIYTTGFKSAAATGSAPQWPPEFLAAVPAPQWPPEFLVAVPAPEDCPIDTVTPLGVDSYSVHCRPAHQGVPSDYQAALEAEGFVVQNTVRTQSGEVISSALAKGDIMVQLNAGFTTSLEVRLSRSLP
jgi:hypothetical protein